MKSKGRHYETERTVKMRNEEEGDSGAFQDFSSNEHSTTDESSEEEFISAKKVKKDDVVMVPIHQKKWLENVTKLADKTVKSSRVALTLSSAAFMPDLAGQKKLQQDNIITSTSRLRYIDAEKNCEKHLPKR